MSIKLLAAELSRFLASAEPEVLCITGEWGVGKTYAWNYDLRHAQQEQQIQLKKYSYVSLFGRNSLDDVRTAIVENTVEAQTPGQRPDLKSFESVANRLSSWSAKLSKIGSYIPKAGDYIGSLNRLLFLSVTNQIICVDDLERTGSGLDAMHVLGLVSGLKEDKSCKVVILLNKDELAPDNKSVFEKQIEKVADTIILFASIPFTKGSPHRAGG